MESTVGNGSERQEKGDGYKRFTPSKRHTPAIDRETLDNWLEKGILGLVLAILVYGPLALGAYRESEGAVIQGLTLGVMGLWAIRLWVRPGYRFLWAPICWVVLAFTGFVVYGYEHALVEWYARQELLEVFTYAVLFFAILDNLHKQEHTQILLLTLIFLGMAISMYAIYQFLSGSMKVWWFEKSPGYHGRASGTYYSPNHFAGFIEMLLPVALGYVFLGRFKALSKVFIGYAAFVMLAGLAVSLSRGAWVASALALLIFFGVLLFRRETRIPALVVIALLVLGGAYFGLKSFNAKNRLSNVKGDQFIRGQLWKPALEIWKESPWIGGGPGHYDLRFRKFRSWHVQQRPVFAHNDYLNTLADHGIIGLGLVLTGLGFCAWGVFKTWKFVKRTNEISNKPSNRSAVVLGSACGLAAILVHSFWDFNMHIPGNAIVVIALLAVVTGHLRFSTERFWVNPGWIGRLSATLLLAVMAWVMVPHIPNAYRHDVLMRKSRNANLTNTQRLEILKKAHEIEPMNPETVLDIAEIYREWGSERYEGYEKHLLQTMNWSRYGLSLNPIDPYFNLNFGMALHWLDRHEDARKYFDRMIELDPENHYLIAMYGWHHLQLNNLEEAQKWLQKSYSHRSVGNELALTYIRIVQRLLAENQKNR